MSKPKTLVFYQYLPPWRIDVFNEMGKYYDMTIAFTDAECEGFTYNRQELLGKLNNIKTVFLNKGFRIGSRPIRFGIYKLIKEVKPVVVFSHEYSATSILLALYKQLGLFRYNYYLTTSDNLKMAESSSGFKAKSRSYVLNHSNGIIVYSESVKQWYQKQFPNLKVDICPNIQNPQTLLSYRSQFEPLIHEYGRKYHLRNTNIMLYTGRLTDVKGLDLLLSAFSKLTDNSYKLVLVGNGHREGDLKKLAQQLKIEDKVVFAGFYTGIELYAWYDMANFFVLPSRYEPFGAVINEALVYGCPVVASKYIGATDFVTSENGCLFDPLNESEFVEALQLACNKYKTKLANRPDLMPCSFDAYVSSFATINL